LSIEDFRRFNREAAFTEQKYTVEGDFSLLMKMNELFRAA
jgi:hypothetical protein